MKKVLFYLTAKLCCQSPAVFDPPTLLAPLGASADLTYTTTLCYNSFSRPGAIFVCPDDYSDDQGGHTQLYQITMKQLLEAGIHFGHQTKRWNPKMARYIYTERNGIYVLDLQQTLKLLEVAYNYIRDLTASGGTVLFVGTKRQAQEAIQQQAERCGANFVNQRWLGGTLTNFMTIRKRTDYLHDLEDKFKNNDFPGLTKKEILKLRKKHDKLQKFFGGVKRMTQIPDCIFIVDLKKEHNAVREARKLGIPVAAILDTNCDPDDADIPIPGNDDAVKAINLFCETIANAIIEGREGRDFAPGGEIPSTRYEESTESESDEDDDSSQNDSREIADKIPKEYLSDSDKD